jgi:hypothetical protein
MNHSRVHGVATLAMLAACSFRASAQDLEPRLYTSAPTGLNFVAVAYTSSDGSVLFDPSVPLEDANLSVDGPMVAYIRSLGLGGKAAKVDVVLPHACIDGYATLNGATVTRNVCGAADARLRLSVNFVGAPALPPQEFAAVAQDFVLGASIQVVAPTGQYDEERLVNIGTNRWAIKPEVGFSKRLKHLSWEMALAASFYSDNDEFASGPLEVEPIYTLQAHVVHVFGNGAWLAGDANHYSGGRSTIAGAARDDSQSNVRFGVTYGLPLNRAQTLRLHASTGVSTRTGSDFDTLAVVWQYRWVSAP